MTLNMLFCCLNAISCINSFIRLKDKGSLSCHLVWIRQHLFEASVKEAIFRSMIISTPVHSSVTHHNQKVKATKGSPYIQHNVIQITKQEGNSDSCYNLDEL